jgi:CRISPR-associated protein Cas1
MLNKDLHSIPKVRDRISYLYAEHARIDKEVQAIAIHDAMGMTPVPCAGLTLLMLGPGVSITHAAILTLADCGCLVAWVGEQGVRFYASGSGTTRSSANLMRQASAWADPKTHMRIVRLMYEMRFPEKIDPTLSLEQIRGKEGARVRDTYFRLSREYNVPMEARNYNRNNWQQTDPINRALSVANSCLYGICHAAIVAAGYSPALGFVHTGKQLSFVYDIADLYKMDTSVQAAFKATAEGIQNLDRHTRIACRDSFYKFGLLKKIVVDIHMLFGIAESATDESDNMDTDPAQPGSLWNLDDSVSPGGVAYGVDDVKKDS